MNANVIDGLSLPGRIGVLGDVHGNIGALVKAFQWFRRVKITHVVQVGDFWCYTDPREVVKVDRQARLNGVEVLAFLDGNHENYTWLGDRVDSPTAHRLSDVMVYLGRGTRFTVGGRPAVALGGAVSTDRVINPRRVIGKGWWPREAVTLADAQAAMSGGPADILFAHDATVEAMHELPLPDRVADTVTAVDEAASRTLLTAVHRAVTPKLTFNGHFHLARKSPDRRFVSLGRDGQPGFAAVLDSVALSVTWPSSGELFGPPKDLAR